MFLPKCECNNCFSWWCNTKPWTDYTVSASTLTFTTAPANGLAFFGLVLGQSIDTEGTADNSITSGMIIDQAVTLAKLPHGTGSTDGKFKSKRWSRSFV